MLLPSGSLFIDVLADLLHPGHYGLPLPRAQQGPQPRHELVWVPVHGGLQVGRSLSSAYGSNGAGDAEAWAIMPRQPPGCHQTTQQQIFSALSPSAADPRHTQQQVYTVVHCSAVAHYDWRPSRPQQQVPLTPQQQPSHHLEGLLEGRRPAARPGPRAALLLQPCCIARQYARLARRPGHVLVAQHCRGLGQQLRPPVRVAMVSALMIGGV